MCYRDGFWLIMKNSKVLAKLPAPTSKCLPDTASITQEWSENYGIYFKRMHKQSSIECIALDNTGEDEVRTDFFNDSTARGSINMDLFVKYSAEPERMGLTIPLFVKYSNIKVASLELQFNSLREKGATDLDNMQHLSLKKHEIERTCQMLMNCVSQLPELQPVVESNAECIAMAISSLLQELDAYFLQLSDLNNGNFEVARRCRDTQVELRNMLQQLRGENTKLARQSSSSNRYSLTKSCRSVTSSTSPSHASAAVAAAASKVAVDAALTSQLGAVDGKVGNNDTNLAAQRIVQDTKNEWSCRISTVGWVPVHERENRTTTEIEWRCTVTIGLSSDVSTRIGAALTGGMSTICAQLSLDVNWASSACKQTEHEHLLCIPPNTKLVVEQEVIEGVITLKRKQPVWPLSMKAKPPKQEAFKVAKDSLRINSVPL